MPSNTKALATRIGQGPEAPTPGRSASTRIPLTEKPLALAVNLAMLPVGGHDRGEGLEASPLDAHEQDADRIADRIASGDRVVREPYRAAPTLTLQRRMVTAVDLARAGSPGVREVIAQPGAPLNTRTAHAMALRFGHDFSHVRVHTDRRAVASADALAADAYTVGRHIVFAHGAYTPETTAGARLLAHELVHVLQQGGGGIALQRRPRKHHRVTVEPRRDTEIVFRFSVKVDRAMDADELLLEFVGQYRRAASPAEARKLMEIEQWRWVGKPQTATAADVRKSYVLIKVRTRTMTAGSQSEAEQNRASFKGMSESDQAEINAATDRQFWDETHYKSGERLGSSADDREMAKYWMALRDELLRQRKTIHDLPPNIKKFLFTEGAPRRIRPQEYATALRIAEKLANLTDQDLDDYKSKTTAVTDDWASFEKSIDDYSREAQYRHSEAEYREWKKTAIYGLEDLFHQYTRWRSLQGAGRFVPTIDEFGVHDPTAKRARDQSREAEATFFANLRAYGFNSVEEFEEALAGYERTFHRETLRIAEDILERFEHVLFLEEQKYRDPASVDALYAMVSRTTAKEHYREAERLQSMAIHSMSPGGGYYTTQLFEQSKGEREKGEQEVIGAAGTEHPLVKGREFHRATLAAAGPKEVHAIIQDYIDDRRTDIKKTRGHLARHPDLVYSLDELLAASYKAQQIEPNSIYDLVIQDKINRLNNDSMLVKIVLAIITIALTIVTFGTGTIAALAGVAAFGLSAYQALEEFREYEIKHAAHGAELLSDDPSFAWVIVAIVGAGADLGAAASAIKAMRPAIEGFNAAVKAGDAAGGAAKLEKDLQSLTEIGEGLRQNVARAARAEAEFQGALKSLVSGGARLNAVVIPADQIIDLVRVVYYIGKRGVIGFDTFIKELRAAKVLGKGTIAAQDLNKLKKLFEDTKAMSQAIAKHGKSLRMKPAEIEAFLARWPDKSGATLEDLKSAMTHWKKGEPDKWFTGQEIDQLVSKLDAGEATRGEMLELAPWKAADKAKKELGPEGVGTQAAHEGPRAALRTLPDYNPEDMLTRMMRKDIHSGMDAYWKRIFRARAGNGEKTIAVQDLYEVVKESINRAPGLSETEKISHIAHLEDELFQQLGLGGTQRVRMPYSK